MRRAFFLLALLVATRNARAGDPPIEAVAWPVARPGARAIVELVASYSVQAIDARVAPVMSQLTSTHAQEVLGGSVASEPDVQVTQGRSFGRWERHVGDEVSVSTVCQDLDEMRPSDRLDLGLGAAGNRRLLRIGALESATPESAVPAPPPLLGSDGSTEEPPVEPLPPAPGERPDSPPPEDEPATALPPPPPAAVRSTWISLALPIAPPAPNVRVGTTWEAPSSRPCLPMLKPDASRWTARHVVTVVSPESITVRSEGTEETTRSSPTPVTTRVEIHLERRYSRKDGLIESGTFEIKGTARHPDRPLAASTLHVQLARTAPQARPPEVAAVDGAIAELASDDAAMRSAAAARLASAWPQGARAVPMLVALRTDEDPGVRAATTAAIERLGSHAIEFAIPFVEGIRAGEPNGFAAIAGVAIALGSALTATDLSTGATAAPYGGVLAAALLASVEPESTSSAVASFFPLVFLAEAKYAEGMALSDPRCVEMACAGLAILGLAQLPASPSRVVPKRLLDAVGTTTGPARFAAIRLVDRLGGTAPEVLAVLRAAEAGSRDPSEQDATFEAAATRAARSALARLTADSPMPEGTIDEAIRLLRDSTQADPSKALDILERVRAGGTGAIPALLSYVKSLRPDEANWARVVRLLGSMGPAAKTALPGLDRFIAARSAASEPGRPSSLALVIAAGSAADIGGATRERVDPLLAGLAPPSRNRSPSFDPRDVFESAATALFRLFDAMPAELRARSLEALTRAVTEDAWEYKRGWIAERLGRLGPKATPAIPRLLAALAQATRVFDGAASGGSLVLPRNLAAEARLWGDAIVAPWALRYAIVDALERIGSNATDAVAALESAVRSNDLLLRVQASRALRRIRR